MNFDKMMKECMRPHALLHLVTGLGVGLLVAALFPGLASVTLGVLVVAVAVVLEMTWLPKQKGR